MKFFPGANLPHCEEQTPCQDRCCVTGDRTSRGNGQLNTSMKDDCLI